jgi:hypothetical protein
MFHELYVFVYFYLFLKMKGVLFQFKQKSIYYIIGIIPI